MDPITIMEGIYIYDNVLSENECNSLINNIHGVNQSMDLNYINDIIEKRCNLPNSIFQKDSHVSMNHYNTQFWYYDNILPEWKATKRDQGGHLPAHFDSVYIKSLNEKSLYTIIIYLSETDGDLKFDNIQVSPKIGRAVIFDLKHQHEALPNTNGTKYFIRSKIMYHRGDNIGTDTDKNALDIYLNSIEIRKTNSYEADELQEKAFSMSPLLERTILCLFD
jgi:hypothetical protein